VRDKNRKDHEDLKDRGYEECLHMRSRFLLRGAALRAAEAAPEEEARAHAFGVFEVFAVPIQATIYIAMYIPRGCLWLHPDVQTMKSANLPEGWPGLNFDIRPQIRP
jgi:hypothetical protein